MTTVTVENVPPETIGPLTIELRRYGARVHFKDQNRLSGHIVHHSGKVDFEHNGIDRLTCKVAVDAGHFPGMLLIGGMKQMIEEAAEETRRALTGPR